MSLVLKSRQTRIKPTRNNPLNRSDAKTHLSNTYLAGVDCSGSGVCLGVERFALCMAQRSRRRKSRNHRCKSNSRFTVRSFVEGQRVCRKEIADDSVDSLDA